MKKLKLSPGPIVFAGDWHGSLLQAFRAVEHARKSGAENILHVGDFGIWPGQTQKFLDRLNNKLVSDGVHISFIDGNHEDHPWLAKQPLDEHGTAVLRSNIRYLPRGTRLIWQAAHPEDIDYSILAMGGAASIDRLFREEGKSWWPEERITDEQAEDCGRIFLNENGFSVHADILLCHDSPAGAPNKITDDPFGQASAARYFGEDILAECNAHREQLRKVSDYAAPYLVVHGHYHMYMEGEFAHDYGTGTRAKVVGLDQGTNVVGKSTMLLSREEFHDMAVALDNAYVDKSGQPDIVGA